MKRALEEALTRCLSRLDEGASIEDCLRGQGSLAVTLRPLLETAQGLRGQGHRIPPHTPQAFQRGRARMHAALAARRAEKGARLPWLGVRLSRPAMLAAVAVVVAVLAAVGFTTNVFRFDADTTAAHVQGYVSRVDAEAIVLSTADGDVIVRIGENTIVLDASGNSITGSDIVPGEPVRIEVEEDGALTAQRIEVEDDEERGHGTEVEFIGVIMSVDGSVITVQASFGVATVRIDSQTETKGTLAQGATVAVHAIRQEDRSYAAQEIEIKQAGSGDVGGRDDDGGHGPDGGRPADDDGGNGNGFHFEREAE